MKILIAEDDLVSRRVLQSTLFNWGHEVTGVGDGTEAWAAMQLADAPRMAILDWMMPGIDGVEVCQRIRGLPRGESVYIILLTARCQKEDIAFGLNNGANDYLVKPFDRQELRARIGVGIQMVQLQDKLAERVKELELALADVKRLEGMLPICAYCHKIRDEENYWQQVEQYISARSSARFSHGICPACWDKVVEPELAAGGINVAGQIRP